MSGARGARTPSPGGAAAARAERRQRTEPPPVSPTKLRDDVVAGRVAIDALRAAQQVHGQKLDHLDQTTKFLQQRLQEVVNATLAAGQEVQRISLSTHAPQQEPAGLTRHVAEQAGEQYRLDAQALSDKLLEVKDQVQVLTSEAQRVSTAMAHADIT